MYRSTTPVVGAVSHGNGALDFYPVLAWLRDTCVPECRPLHSVLNDHYDDQLMAAVVLRHYDGRGSTHELVIIHNHLLKRFTSHMCRQAPTWSEFTHIAGVNY
ncbi:hypothetical protein D3C76_89550 [compost metagenome]